MKCKCKYYLMENGVRVCVQCGTPAHGVKIEDKVAAKHETKAPLYISDKDRQGA